MSVTWSEMREAYREAERTINAANSVVADMAAMIVGRLRGSNVSDYVLTQLKRELKNYDAHRKTWVK